ncbi:hypothetical protein [Pseudodesulfovibrio sediminis]|uniref:Uncharacterized protein n=1 Tax=Pseudodesulfovibrio sediminis TaxID=2810563 RepID=A0ABN6ERH0_9BACT|nr:hypothetical protein [Pseudodesulfovibrio sediminis]BCS88022.1 hypothetical protein PSDVSF_12640 [Pseudodesulfovibrio sediminis]
MFKKCLYIFLWICAMAGPANTTGVDYGQGNQKAQTSVAALKILTGNNSALPGLIYATPVASRPFGNE